MLVFAKQLTGIAVGLDQSRRVQHRWVELLAQKTADAGQDALGVGDEVFQPDLQVTVGPRRRPARQARAHILAPPVSPGHCVRGP